MATHKNVDIVYTPTHEHPLGVSHGNLNMARAPYRYTLRRTPKLWGSVQFLQIIFSLSHILVYL